MSNEASISQRSRKILKEKGWTVLKFNDSSTSGVPDMAIAKGGYAFFVEDKYVSVQIGFNGKDNDKILETGIQICARDFISQDRMVQMVTMCQLENSMLLSEYWLYIECGGKHYIAALRPSLVFRSYMDKTELCLNVMRIGEWLNLLDTLVSNFQESSRTELSQQLSTISQNKG